MLDRGHLQLLVALRETGRLGDAARLLHLSPSAASHRLAEAERRAGTRLTEATGRTLQLTPAGEHLAEAAADIERDITRAELTARWIGTGEAAHIRVAVGFFDTASWLLDTFSPPPGVPRIELLRLRDDQLLDAVRNRTADIALAPWPIRPTGLQHVELAGDVLAAAVPADSSLADGDRVTAEELDDHAFLVSDYRPARGFEFTEFFLRADVAPTTTVRVQSLEMMLRLVGAGHGVTIQPSLVLTWNRPHRTVEIVPLAGPDIAVTWYATFRRDADAEVAEAAERIRGAFVEAASRGEGSTR